MTATQAELQRSIDDLAVAMSDYALAKVRAALALERDRYDAELAELRDEICALSNRLEGVTRRERA